VARFARLVAVYQAAKLHQQREYLCPSLVAQKGPPGIGVPVASVQKTSIRTSMSKAVEENEGLRQRLLWKKSLNFSGV
jgi:hypothetical protein